MEPDLSGRQLSHGEKETETEATRLIELIEDALAVVAVRTTAEVDSLEAISDRIERAARDFSVALRELAEQRRIAQDALNNPKSRRMP
ncbi:MAG: hypothetical protein M3R52_04965 [Acidobacteriota bacterium]|nr:hypothetical protein [Acidobacteriota bacterium]